MYLPEWDQKHKEPRTEIRRIKNGFYKYEVAFVYNKDKKRTEKKTVRLREAELLSKYSPKDIIELSKAICQMKIRNRWIHAEITQKTTRLFKKIGIDYLI